MEFDKNEVTPNIIDKIFKESGIPKEKITSELINYLRDELIKNKIINESNILTKDAKEIHNINFKNKTLKEHESKIKENLAKYMVERGSRRIPITNGDNDPIEQNAPHSYVTEDVFRKIINKLTTNLNKRTIYRAKVNKHEFIEQCAKELDDNQVGYYAPHNGNRDMGKTVS